MASHNDYEFDYRRLRIQFATGVHAVLGYEYLKIQNTSIWV